MKIMGRERYDRWRAKINEVATELAAKEQFKGLLTQYQMWLEASEETPTFKGKDVYDMILGSLLSISEDADLFPGVGWENYVAVVSEVQRKTGLDLGVCQFLEDNIDANMRYKFLGERGGEFMPTCKAKELLMVGSLSCCIPPQRIDCEHRKAKLEQTVSEL